MTIMQTSGNNDNLHILHCNFSMTTGGAETMLVDIINGQIAKGAHVTYIVINNLIDESLLSKLDKRTDIIRMDRKPGSNPLLLMWKLNSLIAKINPDIIHVHNHKLCRLIRRKRDRLLFTVHDINTPMKYTANVKMAAITDAVESYIRQSRPDAKVATILNGIRTQEIKPREDRPLPDTFRLVQVGRLTSRKKGQDILIDAVGILKKRGIDNVEVTFIGDGPDYDCLKARAASIGVSTRVHFAGLRDREYIYTTLKDYDAMCHPSRWEGFGLIIAEAMAAGLPLLVTAGDGPWEVADHGRLCISFTGDNPEACANAIEQLISNYNEALRIAADGREFVAKYDISNTVDNYLKLYRDIIKGEF